MRGHLKRCPECGHVVEVRKKPLSVQQFRVLEVIRASVRTHGYAPTFAEIRSALGWRADSTVHERLVDLEAKGYIHREFNKERGITLVDPLGAHSAEPLAGVSEVETLLSAVRRHQAAGEIRDALECCDAIVQIVEQLEREQSSAVLA